MDNVPFVITATLFIISVLLFILGIAVCFAILSIKNAINDIADVYCKINKSKYESIKEQEEENELVEDD